VTAAADHLHAVHDGPAWHGPSLHEALDGVDATLAVRRPPNGAHSIVEIAAHVSIWLDVCRRWLEGEAADVADEENFPGPGDGAAAWQQLRATLDARAAALEKAMRRFPASRLAEIVPGRDYTFAALLQGLPCHTVYHAGQISLLKRILLESGGRR
jgi:uncharacterized damage-inducible protein DinB